jgi:hypothetical protein
MTAALATGDLAALDAAVAGEPRVALAIHVRHDGAELTVSGARRIVATAIAPAPVVQRVLAWALQRAAGVLVGVDAAFGTTAFDARAHAVLDVLGATAVRVELIRGEPQSERGEPPEYGQPGVALELTVAGGHALRATLLQGLVPADDYAAVIADYGRRAQALAATLGVTCPP